MQSRKLSDKIEYYSNRLYVFVICALSICNVVVLALNYDAYTLQLCDEYIILWLIVNNVILYLITITLVFKIKNMYEGSTAIDLYNLVILFLFLVSIGIGYYIIIRLNKCDGLGDLYYLLLNNLILQTICIIFAISMSVINKIYDLYNYLTYYSKYDEI